MKEGIKKVVSLNPSAYAPTLIVYILVTEVKERGTAITFWLVTHWSR